MKHEAGEVAVLLKRARGKQVRCQSLTVSRHAISDLTGLAGVLGLAGKLHRQE